MSALRIIRAADYDDMSKKAANIIFSQITLKPDSVLGLATGSTPIGAYKKLIEWCQSGDLDFSRIHSVNLDEYCGLAPEHEQSYRFFMETNLFRHVNIKPENTNVPNGLAEDVQAECARYEKVIQDLGGIDLQRLGLGHTGHVGFNEPSESFDKTTHCVELNPVTIEANARFFASEKDVPRRAVTMGIQTIMHAKKLLLVANGEGKAEILCAALFGPVTPAVPASILQMHQDVTVVADEAALSVIQKKYPDFAG